MVLVGADAISSTFTAGDTLPVRLVWSATVQPTRDYTLFVHLVDATGVPLAQNDRPPLNDFYPTGAWEPGIWVEERYALHLPATIAPGEYRLISGLYDPLTNTRLLTADGTDSYRLATITITAP